MTILRDISIVWSMLHVLVLFVFLYQSRFSKKTTIISTLIAIVVWLAVQVIILFTCGPVVMSQLVILTGTIPSFIFFWVMSKERDGRFLFTFCLCDTLSAEILMITNLLDYFLFGGQFIGMLVLRIILFPLLEVFVFKVLRPVLREVQGSVGSGWYSFAGVSVIFYIILVLLGSFPNELMHSAPMIPVNVLILLLMPLMYFNIFQALRRQKRIYELAEQDNILKMQVLNMQQRISQFSESDEKNRIERHDMRHRLHAVAELLQKGKMEEVKEYLLSYEEKMESIAVKRYCANPILDAVFTAYFREAQQKGIEVTASLAIPERLTVDVAELSTVFANAIENAIRACEKLPPEQRKIEVRAISHPQFMFQVINPYAGEVKLDERGVPIAKEKGHGFGTRSILAFCDKYSAFREFKMEDGKFALRIVLGGGK